jgi:hypothetical protein
MGGIDAANAKRPERDDLGGTGSRNEVARHLGRREARRWVITTFAGAEAERDALGRESIGEARDLRAIAAMLDKLHLDWDEERLAALRARARHLVERERDRIGLVADALVQHRYLTAAAVRAYAPSP